MLQWQRELGITDHNESSFQTSLKKGGTRTMAMEIVLDLQKLEVPQEEDLFGSSTGSSTSDCCNGRQQ
jgi:hypothetical protein